MTNEENDECFPSIQGKGHAEMAVSRCRTFQSGITTPESIPSTPMSSSFDEESVRSMDLSSRQVL